MHIVFRQFSYTRDDRHQSIDHALDLFVIKDGLTSLQQRMEFIAFSGQGHVRPTILAAHTERPDI